METRMLLPAETILKCKEGKAYIIVRGFQCSIDCLRNFTYDKNVFFSQLVVFLFISVNQVIAAKYFLKKIMHLLNFLWPYYPYRIWMI